MMLPILRPWLVWFATQMLAPSKATPSGPLPTTKVQVPETSRRIAQARLGISPRMRSGLKMSHSAPFTPTMMPRGLFAPDSETWAQTTGAMSEHAARTGAISLNRCITVESFKSVRISYGTLVRATKMSHA